MFKAVRRIYDIYKINKHCRDRLIEAEKRDEIYIEKMSDNLKICSCEQINEINKFWDDYKFAYYNNPLTQIIYYNQSGIFDPSFIGHGQQEKSLVRFWNNEIFSVFKNKNYSRLLFSKIKHPYIYASCSYGIYSDDKSNIISRHDTIRYILNILKTKKLVLKPTLDTGEGRNIEFIDSSCSYEQLHNYIVKLGRHFVCQEHIENHPTYITCRNTLNTIRVTTLIINDNVLFVGAIFRMSAGKKVDNCSLACRMNEEGILSDFAVTGKGKKHYKHPNGYAFKNIKLFKADEIIRTAKKCHLKIPQQKYISWDFTIDKEDNIVFMEMNSPGNAEFLQRVGIHPYLNKDILKTLLDKYIYLVKANYNWDYKEHRNYVILLKYHGINKNVNIPMNLNNKVVKYVAMRAFCDCKIESIKIPKEITFYTDYLKDENIIIERT